MAKKIRLDFTKTTERSGWNTRQIAAGIHRMRIDSVQETEASDGTAMLVYALVPTEQTLRSRRFPFYCKLQQNQFWKLRDLLVAAGERVPQQVVSIDPAKIVGREIAAEVDDDAYQGTVRSSVQGTYGLDLLDEAGSIGQEDELTDNEDDDLEEEFEEIEEEADEEELDLDGMALPELRKLAREYGIDTKGLKKDDLIDELTDAMSDGEEDEDEDEVDLDDEDDLDDEELEDEDEEEDEEPEPEPEPEPRRPARRVAKRR